MKCELCKFEYFFNSAAAVSAIIIDSKSRIMLTRRAFNPEKGKLDLPGGFVEHNETAEEAIVRELNEELGAMVKNIKYFGSFSNKYEYSELTIHTLDTTFIIELDNKPIKAMDDVESFSYWDINDIPINELAFQSTKNTIIKLKDK